MNISRGVVAARPTDHPCERPTDQPACHRCIHSNTRTFPHTWGGGGVLLAAPGGPLPHLRRRAAPGRGGGRRGLGAVHLACLPVGPAACEREMSWPPFGGRWLNGPAAAVRTAAAAAVAAAEAPRRRSGLQRTLTLPQKGRAPLYREWGKRWVGSAGRTHVASQVCHRHAYCRALAAGVGPPEGAYGQLRLRATNGRRRRRNSSRLLGFGETSLEEKQNRRQSGAHTKKNPSTAHAPSRSVHFFLWQRRPAERIVIEPIAAVD